MSRRLPKTVKDNLEKCQLFAVAAVDAYNRPGKKFRTAQYVVMITIAWTALLHAIFYKKKTKPLYKKNQRYIRVDGEPKHWDLRECVVRFYGSEHPAERRNLEFLIGLRNKIEHRNLPELDPSLYGECQAALLNLEALLVRSFGNRYALEEQLAISLQFSSVIPEEKKRAARTLASASVKDVRDYVDKFRGGLPSTVLSSMKYSFNVFLIPKVVNREKSADAAVEFIHIDEASKEEVERLEKLNVLVREKNIPIVNLDLFRPKQVLEKVNKDSNYKLTMNAHASLWRHFKVRPATGDASPNKCDNRYCNFDEAHQDYLYTKAWIKKCLNICNDPEKFLQIIGREPEKNQR